MTTVATTAQNGVILQLQNAPADYTPTPLYGSVTILPPSKGGGAEFTRGSTLIQTPTVDTNFWTAWAAENADNPLLVNGQIIVT
jgi:hypothetical protein